MAKRIIDYKGTAYYLVKGAQASIENLKETEVELHNDFYIERDIYGKLDKVEIKISYVSPIAIADPNGDVDRYGNKFTLFTGYMYQNGVMFLVK